MNLLIETIIDLTTRGYDIKFEKHSDRTVEIHLRYDRGPNLPAKSKCVLSLAAFRDEGILTKHIDDLEKLVNVQKVIGQRRG